MTHFSRLTLAAAALALAALPARAVYAPIPEPEQGKALTFSTRAGVSYDSNIFGAATDAIGSTIWELAPKVAYNASVTDQTFMTLSYELTLDYFNNRPGEQTLDSHAAVARVAHAFTKSTILDVVEMFQAQRNPESLLNGLPLNVDQSLDHNELDVTFTTPIDPKTTIDVKGRSLLFDYRDDGLGRQLDHIENLYGLSLDYALTPDLKLVGEGRHEDVYYRKLGETKNKHSNFLVAGADYAAAKKFTLTGRLGVDWRDRAAERSVTSPYAEFSAKYDYAEGSFLSSGYIYTFEETSDVVHFDDTRVNRFFVNLQHSITALVVASASVTYEPSRLQGRIGQPSIDETTTRAGAALSWLPTKNWLISGTYDYDHVDSGIAARDLDRNRVGANATLKF